MASVNVLFFARARELAGTSASNLTLPDGSTVADVRAKLLLDTPALASVLTTAIFALNQSYVAVDAEASTVVKTGDELAIVPPISGG